MGYELNRQVLADKIFKSDSEVKSLRRITSPKIRELLLEKIEACDKAVVVVEGAGLIEANYHDFFDDFWLCSLPKDEAFKRV